ncbi:hypothetical protein AABM36_04210 [Kocuria sp. KSNUG]|uniref:hypothetical protein n=1 Tax=Kocuria TaxID=57493 RepID=UPI003879BA99
MRKIATLVLVVLLSAGTTACSRDEDGLPEYASLNDAYGAVDAVVNCDTNPPAPTEKVLHPPGPTGESRMCTDTLEVLWFDSKTDRDKVFDLLASAAGLAGSVSFVKGRNWLVSDYSDLDTGVTKQRSVDMEAVARSLHGQFVREG